MVKYRELISNFAVEEDWNSMPMVELLVMVVVLSLKISEIVLLQLNENFIRKIYSIDVLLPLE